MHDGERNLLLRSMGAFENVQQIEDLIIRPAGRAADGSMTAAVHLHHLGHVEEGYEETDDVHDEPADGGGKRGT